MPRANLIAGEWRAARGGAVFQPPVRPSAPGEPWPQSGAEDVEQAWKSARAGAGDWRALDARRREELLCALARELERDELLAAGLAERFELRPEEVAPHLADLERSLAPRLERSAPADAGGQVVWLAPDWRELVRGPLLDVARELAAGRPAVLVSDARLPLLAERIAAAAVSAGVYPGALGLLHGPTRELVALALARPERGATLRASGTVERMVELRRLCEEQGVVEPRLRALRCEAFEVDGSRSPEESAATVVARAFGRGECFSGQLPGTLGRVFCPARLFSRFSALLLERLESSEAVTAPVPQVDDEAAARVRSAWELGLDEGATCIAGGDGALPASSRALPPTVFTNVEPHMASARRQDPLPVLCLLRS
jgi:acyl-CoA reductase-like NAD-dependent aldehyde dehydrogenase